MKKYSFAITFGVIILMFIIGGWDKYGNTVKVKILSTGESRFIKKTDGDTNSYRRDQKILIGEVVSGPADEITGESWITPGLRFTKDTLDEHALVEKSWVEPNEDPLVEVSIQYSVAIIQ